MSVFFVVLVVQVAKPIHRIIFSAIVCLAVPYFFTFSQKKKGTIFGKMFLNTKFSTTFV